VARPEAILARTGKGLMRGYKRFERSERFDKGNRRGDADVNLAVEQER
jgi:hypothetical protein